MKLAGVLVIALYAAITLGRPSEFGARTPREEYYNLLVDGFRAGHLSLARQPPAGLAALPNPYDPKQNEVFRGENYIPDRAQDLSYLDGKFYLYFGVTPALVLFWPFAAVTGNYLAHSSAVFVFTSVGFVAAALMLSAMRRRYFPKASKIALSAGVFAIGLGCGIPIMLNRPDVWEVAIACGFAFTMLALYCLWRSVHEPARRVGWLVVASLCFGLAVGARPSLLFGFPILLAPVVLQLRDRLRLIAAAVVPIGLIGIGVAIYNYERFGSVTDFGQNYQLGGEIIDRDHFGFVHLWTNLKSYFVGIPKVSADFPYVVDSATPTLPGAIHGGIERPLPLLIGAPFAWFALLLPFLWRRSPLAASREAVVFVGSLGFVVAATALPLLFYYGTCERYEVDFAPALFVIAGVGFLAAETACVNGAAWRLPVVIAGVALAVGSSGFNLLAGLAWRAELNVAYGDALFQEKRYEDAAKVLETALEIVPRHTKAQADLELALRAHGEELRVAGRIPEQMAFLQRSVARLPRSAALHADLGATLFETGKFDDSLKQFEEALGLDPRNLAASVNLGILNARIGHRDEAIIHWRRALDIDPNQPVVQGYLQQLERTPAAGN